LTESLILQATAPLPIQLHIFTINLLLQAQIFTQSIQSCGNYQRGNN